MVVRTVLITVLLSLVGKIVYSEILIDKPDKTQPYNSTTIPFPHMTIQR